MSEPITITPVYDAANCQANILNAVKDAEVKRAFIADLYADCICGGGGIEWPIVNRATIARFGEADLIAIKRKAWQIVAERRDRRFHQLNVNQEEKP
jgi:hypothetical protein